MTVTIFGNVNIRNILFLLTHISIYATIAAFTVNQKSLPVLNGIVRGKHLYGFQYTCKFFPRSCGHASRDITTLTMSKDDTEEHIKTPSSTAVVHPGIPKVTAIHNQDELLEFLAEDDRLCVVKIYASWCKSCHKFGVKFRHFAQQHADLTDNKGTLIHKGQVRFAEIEYGANRILCKSFGIKKLPYVQMYKMSPDSERLASLSVSDESDNFIKGQIDGFVCGPAKFERLVAERVDRMVETGISDDEKAFQKNMEDGQTLANELMEQTSGFTNGKNVTSRLL